MDDGAGAGGTLLALIAERRSEHTVDGRIEIYFPVDNDRVLAAHFGDDALDPELAGVMLGSQLVDAQTHVARTGEGDKTRLGMRHEGIADFRAGASEEAERLRREAGLKQQF